MRKKDNKSNFPNKEGVFVEENEGKYIYCIIEGNSHDENFGPLGIGDRDDELHTICYDNITAVVSNSPIIKYSVSRENTITHERAIEEVMKTHTVLPVRFGTIAESQGKVKKILEKEHDRFKEMLDSIKGKKELGLKAMFKDGVIYNEILENYKNIKKAKDAIAAKPPEVTYFERVQIGRMVEQALEKEREKYKEEILGVLRPLAEDTKINNVYGEKMIINAAFLVNEDKEPEFDQKVRELDEKYGNKIKFKYVGTLPPFNFVNLVINTEDY